MPGVIETNISLKLDPADYPSSFSGPVEPRIQYAQTTDGASMPFGRLGTGCPLRT